MCREQHTVELCNHGWMSFIIHRKTWFYMYKMCTVMSIGFNVERSFHIPNSRIF